MKTLSILSRHSSAASAVAAAGIDLSYNERLALEDLRDLDSGDARRGTKPVTEAFVVDGGIRDGAFAVEVYYVYDAGKHGVLLNKYTPFHGSLHDGAFSFAIADGDVIRITAPISRDREVMIRSTKTLSEAGPAKVWLHKA